jgi:hypothetical protein
MKDFPKITELSLRTYPTWWQERYRDEMQAVVEGLVEEGKSSISIAVNLIGGSLRARMLGTGAPASRRLWSRRTQTALLVATLPWFAMIPLVAIFAANSGEYGFFHGNTNVQLSRAGVFARDLQSTVINLLLVSFVIVLIGYRRLRRALEQREKGSWLPRVSFVAAMVGVALFLIAVPFGHYSATSTSCSHLVGNTSTYNCPSMAPGLTIAQIIARIGLGFIVIAFLLAPFVIAHSVRASALQIEVLRSGSRVATALSTLLILMTLAISACGVATSLQPTPQKGMSYWMVRSAHGGLLALLVVGFVITAVISSLGTFAARKSYRRTVSLEV